MARFVPCRVRSREELEKLFKNIGKHLIDNAESLSMDWNRDLMSINIETVLEPENIVTIKVTKEYPVKEENHE